MLFIIACSCITYGRVGVGDSGRESVDIESDVEFLSSN